MTVCKGFHKFEALSFPKGMLDGSKFVIAKENIDFKLVFCC